MAASRTFVLADSALIGAAVYFVADRDGQVWNGSAFEDTTAANWSTYDLPMADPAGTGRFVGELPAAIDTGTATLVTVYHRKGAAPAVGDPVVGVGEIGGSAGGGGGTVDLADFFTVDTGMTYADAVPGSVVREIAANSGGGGDATGPEIEAIRAVTDKLDTTLELDGPAYRYTAQALAQAPAGGGGGITPGSVIVDHDYGGPDNLTYKTASGAGVSAARVRAYLSAEWDADQRSTEFIRGETYTNPDGRWAYPIMLDPGDYTIQAYKSGVFGPDIRQITVVA